MGTDRIKGHLDLLLMSALGRGPAHGYAIMTTLRERSGGAFDLPEGTIYPALHRLEQRGLVSSTWTTAGGRRRRIYALTDRGRTASATEQAEWEGFHRGISAVLGLAT
jgi:PadR family transcriptional regulator, regulatory protein PadR